MDLPDWLAATVGRWSPAVYRFRETEEFLDIMDGDIVLVGGMDLSESNRLVAVLEVDADRRCFLGALVTNELDLATAEDVILDSDQTDLPYQVAVMSGLAMHLWFVQIEERLGALSGVALEAAVAGYYGREDQFLTSHRGVPLQERMMDMRWPECEREGDKLVSLARDCTNKRWDEELGLPYVDPRLLPVAGDSYNEFHSETLRVLEEATRKGRTRGFSPSCVEQVAGTLDRRSMRAYPTMLQPKGSISTSPPTCREQDDTYGWFFDLTKADALAGAGFVKMIGLSEPSEAVLFSSNGQPYEFLYERI